MLCLLLSVVKILFNFIFSLKSLQDIALDSKFSIEVMDYDATSKDDQIGSCEYIFDAKV
jgi:hypothetical protein